METPRDKEIVGQLIRQIRQKEHPFIERASILQKG
jgi:hypothetical protein